MRKEETKMIASDKVRRTFSIAKNTSDALSETCKTLSISPSVFVDLILRSALDSSNKDPVDIGTGFVADLLKAKQK